FTSTFPAFARVVRLPVSALARPEPVEVRAVRLVVRQAHHERRVQGDRTHQTRHLLKPRGENMKQGVDGALSILRRRVVTAVCLVAAGAVVGAARPQYGGTLRIEMRAIVRTLDPMTAANDAADSAAGARL